MQATQGKMLYCSALKLLDRRRQEPYVSSFDSTLTFKVPAPASFPTRFQCLKVC